MPRSPFLPAPLATLTLAAALALAGCASPAPTARGTTASLPAGTARAAAGTARAGAPADDASDEDQGQDREAVNAVSLGSQVTSLEELLRRRPGVRIVPGPYGPEVRIRGHHREPLFMLDGMPLSSSRALDVLDLHDVAAVDVLIRPDETAPYGPRASGGVVLVTTKRRKAPR